MFKEFLKFMEQGLIVDGSIAEIESAIEKSAKMLIDNLEMSEEKEVSQLVSGNDEFVKRNRLRWGEGFKKLHALRMVCLEAGMNFQKLVLAIP